MTAAEMVAVEKAAAKAAKPLKGEILEGTESKVDVTVRVTGTLSRGEGTEKVPTCNLLSLQVLAKALAYAGVTAEAFKAALLKAAESALLNGKAVGEQVSDEDARIAEVVREITNEVAKKLPRQPVEIGRAHV